MSCWLVLNWCVNWGLVKLFCGGFLRMSLVV